MLFKDEDGRALFEDAIANNIQDDGYGSCGILFAAMWAGAMEREIASGNTIEACAKDCSDEADKTMGVWGMTGFLYGIAVSLLAQTWIHGEALRRWHNLATQIGDEGERANEAGTTLNPALLNVQTNNE